MDFKSLQGLYDVWDARGYAFTIRLFEVYGFGLNMVIFILPEVLSLRLNVASVLLPQVSNIL